MKTFIEIQQLVDSAFKQYLDQVLRLQEDKLKYFYWSESFFSTVGNLSFHHFDLSDVQNDFLNQLGREYFSEKSIYFDVDKTSIRNELAITNYSKLFDASNKVGQALRYNYIREFVFWQLLQDYNKKGKSINESIVEQQKKNFLSTYVKYLINNTKRPSYSEFKNYKKFTQTLQGEELTKKLEELYDNGVDNTKLNTKIDQLYILDDDKTNMHFVFSRNGGEEKEELRELLDVMGRKNTGKLYRGQANSSWKLDASITREPKYLENEAEMYYDILSVKPDAFQNDSSVYERLITMQHFGMPTRLLDITRNPLVAIFFACNNLQHAKYDGTVYTFAPENKDFLNFEDPRLEGLKLLYDKSNGNGEESEDIKGFLDSVSYIKGVAKNQRISRQSGDFIFVGRGPNATKDLNEIVALAIIIDAPTKKVLIEQLETLNIHGGAVYPDLTSMSNYVKNKFKINKVTVSDELKIDLEADIKKLEEKSGTENSKVLVEVSNETLDALINDFNENLFWTDDKIKQLENFAKKEKLKQDLLRKSINKYFFTNRKPVRSDVSEIMLQKPKLNELKTIVQPLVEKIIAFANSLNIDKS